MVAIRSKLGLFVQIAIAGLVLSGCGSGAVKARRELRDRNLQTSKLYCEFVNGENNPADVDVALNVSMQQRCDNEKPFSLSTYKTPSEVQGIVYCCSMPGTKDVVVKKEEPVLAKAPEVKPEHKVEAKKPETKPADVPSFEFPKETGHAPDAPKKPEAPKKAGDNSYPTIPDLDP